MAHHRFSTVEVEYLRRQLLSFYAANKRDLPWRHLGNTLQDPHQRAYSIWVSEVMLQQTQVATVIDYYNKWIKRWPTVLDLAKASLEEVNEMWSGLGYYSRGRRLHEGAQKLAKQRGKKSGQMPLTAKDLMKELPGVGRYTAGAIASIAYNEVTGIVDGNVIRVMARLRMIGGEFSSQPVIELIWELANKVVDDESPGDFNQSLMELGATVCTPRNPKCVECPVNKICKAYKRDSLHGSKTQSTITDAFNITTPDKTKINNASVTGDDRNAGKQGKGNDVSVKEEEAFEILGQMAGGTSDIEEKCDDQELDSSFDITNYNFSLTDIEDFPDCKFCIPSEEPWDPQLGVTNYPRKPKKKPPCAEKYLSIIVEYNFKYLFTQRPENGLLANMWEFPLTEIEKENKENIENNVIKKELKRRFSLTEFDYVRFCGEASHVFSHRCHLYRVYHVSLVSAPETVEDADGRSVKWMKWDEAEKAAITSAIKKIMNVKDKCKKGKRKRSVETKSKNQKTLDKMFVKKTKKEEIVDPLQENVDPAKEIVGSVKETVNPVIEIADKPEEIIKPP